MEHDTFGRIKMWQDMRIGSNNGYVAVSPDGGEDDAVYVITNSLDHGHGVREPSGRALRYQPRIQGNGMYVRGYQFYSATKLHTESIAIHAAEKGLTYWENAMESYLSQLVSTAFADTIDLDFDTMAGKTYTVSYNRISYLLLSIPGVKDYTALTVGGATANITIAADEVPVLTGVTVS